MIAIVFSSQTTAEMFEKAIHKTPLDLKEVKIFHKFTKTKKDLLDYFNYVHETCKALGVNLIVDATRGYISQAYKEGLFFEYNNLDSTYYKQLGVVEINDIKHICGLRYDTILREKNNREILDDEFLIKKHDCNIVDVSDDIKLKQVMNDIVKADWLALDIETKGFRYEDKSSYVLSIQVTPNHNKLTSYVIWIGQNPSELIKKAIQYIHKKKFVYHNGLFDLKWIYRFFNVEPLGTNYDDRLDFEDTLIMKKILTNSVEENKARQQKLGLKHLCFKYLADWDSDLDTFRKEYCSQNKLKKDDFTYDLIPKDMLKTYAGYDTIALAHLYEEILLENENHPLRPLDVAWYGKTKESIPFVGYKEIAINTIQLMVNGIGIREDELNKLIQVREAKVAEISESIKNDTIIKTVEKKLTEKEIIKTDYKTKFNNYLARLERYNERVKEYEAKVERAKSKGKELKSKPPVEPKEPEKPNISFNFNSTPHLIELFINTMGLPILETTDKGNPSVGKQQIAKYIKDFGNQFPILELFDGLSQTEFELNTYLRAWREYSNNSYDGRVHSNFGFGTASYRYDSKAPNVMNLKKESDLKYALGSDTNFIVSQDLASLEVRSSIELCRDKFMIECFEKGLTDEHSINLIHASKVSSKFKLDDDYDALNPKHLKIVKDKFDGLRRKAKGISFALQYLATPNALIYGLEVERDEGIALYENWWNVRDGYKEFVEKLWREYHTLGYTYGYGGVIIQTPYGLGEDCGTFQDFIKNYDKRDNQQFNIMGTFRTFVNFTSQSASWITKRAMCYLNKYIKQNDLKAKVISEVHDDMLLEVPKEEVDIIYHKQKEFMKFKTKDDELIPMDTECEIGKSLKCEIGKYEGDNRIKLKERFGL